MKKYFIIGFLLVFCFGVFAQRPTTLTIPLTSSYPFNGSVGAGDWVNKNTTVYYNYYTPALFNTAQFQVLLDTVTGKPKARLYLYQSADGSNWQYVDSATTILGGLKGISTKSTVFNPYLQFRVKGVDSTQKTVILKVIANLKID
jgi:hypothetical protein